MALEGGLVLACSPALSASTFACYSRSLATLVHLLLSFACYYTLLAARLPELVFELLPALHDEVLDDVGVLLVLAQFLVVLFDG